MEALFDFCVWGTGLALIPLAFTVFWDYWYLSFFGGLFLIILWPLFQEIIFAVVQSCRKKSGFLDRDYAQIDRSINTKHPIVYSSGYNISAFGLEKMHPFDSQKYGRVYNFLVEWGVIQKDTKLLSPSICPRPYLYEVCSFKHMVLLNYSAYIGMCVELPICFLPSWMIRWRVLNPMLRATYGTIIASFMAMARGVAINLSGGYHHACGNSGGGFCIYPDITLAIKMVRRFCNVKRVMIIDLDAHQGNGHERDFLGDDNVYIIDAFRPDIYPGDKEAKKAINKEIHVYPKDDAESYLMKLQVISKCIDEFKPEFIMYNAGTDIMKGDPLSGLNISEQGVIDRDELVINCAFDRSIPICMVLSGGYQKINAECIAKSVKNVFSILS